MQPLRPEPLGALPMSYKGVQLFDIRDCGEVLDAAEIEWSRKTTDVAAAVARLHRATHTEQAMVMIIGMGRHKLGLRDGKL
jgi:hypothetical protein